MPLNEKMPRKVQTWSETTLRNEQDGSVSIEHKFVSVNNNEELHPIACSNCSKLHKRCGKFLELDDGLLYDYQIGKNLHALNVFRKDLRAPTLNKGRRVENQRKHQMRTVHHLKPKPNKYKQSYYTRNTRH